MAQLAAAVNLVTSRGPAGLAAFTASAVTSVTDDPATLLVCAKRTGSATAFVVANGVLCVNVLAREQEALSVQFGNGRDAGADRFAGVAWSVLVTGSPVLDGAVASFDCRIARVVEVGTHSVLLCEVLDVTERAGRSPLIYFRREYRTLG